MARISSFSLLLAMALAFGFGAWRPSSHSRTSTVTDRACWTRMMESMGRMHSAMSMAEPSNDGDMDFVSLMLPHHQGALDMAKAELICGKDPQIRRLAQEIVTDQASEIQLMRLWRQQRPGANTENPTQGPLSNGQTER